MKGPTRRDEKPSSASSSSSKTLKTRRRGEAINRKTFISPRSSVASSSSCPSIDVPEEVSSNGLRRGPRLLSLEIMTLVGRPIPIQISSAATVKDLKDKIYESEGILSESQSLVFCDRQLQDYEVLGQAGMETGSTVKLVVQMSGGVNFFCNSFTKIEFDETGPGMPIKGRPRLRRSVRIEETKSPSSVLLLLCRQNDQLFMVEVHMKQTGEPGDETRKELLKLAQGSGGVRLIDAAKEGNIKNKSPSLNGEGYTQILGLGSRPDDFQDLIAEEIFGEEAEDESVPQKGSRKRTQDLSIEDDLNDEEGDLCSGIEEEDFYGGNSDDEDEGLSFFYSNDDEPRSRSLSVLSASSSTYLTLSQDSMTPRCSKSRESRNRARPATAISLMRLPCPPTLFSPQTRPSTAKLIVINPVEDPSTVHTCPSVSSRKSSCRPKSVRFQVSSLPMDSSTESLDPYNMEIHTMTPQEKKSLIMDEPDKIKNSLENLKISPHHKEEKERPLACLTCHKHLTLTTFFKCRCGSIFCSVHRYSDRHGCSFDYRAAGASQLRAANPGVSRDKVLHI